MSEALGPVMAHARGSSSLDRSALSDRLRDLGAQLLEVQSDLAQLRQQVADDPLLELEEGERLDQLESNRTRLLDAVGRTVLAWLQQGGRVELAPLAFDDAAPLAVREAEPPSLPPASQKASTPGARPLGLDADEMPTIPPQVAVDPSALRDALRPSWSSARQTRPTERVDAPPADPKLLPMVMAILGEPPATPLESSEMVEAELERLVAASSQEQTSRWIALPRATQKALVGNVVARARHIQDEVDPDLFDEGRRPQLDRIFSGMTAYSKREQPGFVFGLMRHHTPVRETWIADARHWWGELDAEAPAGGQLNPERALASLEDRAAAHDEAGVLAAARAVLDAGVAADDPRLVRLAAPWLSALHKSARFKKLRRAIRDSEDAALPDEPLTLSGAIPADWPFWGMVRGKRAAIIGGDLREDARRRIETSFGFSMLDWVTTDHARNVQTLASAVSGGAIEFVIVLRRYIGHDVDRIVLPACKSRDVPWASVERGYGVTQVRLAIERFLDPEDDEDAEPAAE